MTNADYAIDALEAAAKMDAGAIAITFPGVSIVFRGANAVEFVALVRRSYEQSLSND